MVSVDAFPLTDKPRTHSLFNCLVYHMLEGQATDPTVVEDAQRKYTLCLNTLYDFGQLCVSASLIHRLFDALQTSRKLFSPRKARIGTAAPLAHPRQRPGGGTSGGEVSRAALQE
jgi:hypothetical protein